MKSGRLEVAEATGVATGLELATGTAAGEDVAGAFEGRTVTVVVV